MSQWADYLISDVCLNNDGAVKQCKIRTDNGKTISQVQHHYTKSQIIQKIESGSTFITIYKKEEKWNKGAEVNVVQGQNGKFIRTDKNQTPKDNLGSLPEYDC